MKKILLLICVLFLGSTLMAQIAFGPKAGYSSSKLATTKSDIKSELKNNFTFGAFLRVGGLIYVQPELNYFTSGSTFTAKGVDSGEFELSMKNIQIPVFIGTKILPLGDLGNIRIQAGPTATFVLSDKTKLKDVPEQMENIYEDFDVKKVQWGLQFGAGIDVWKLTLDVQYQLGLTNVFKDYKVLNASGEEMKMTSKNRGFVVTLGFKLFG